MINIWINGVLTNYKVGFNIQEHLNETLDSGVLVIPQSSELQLEPLDKVTIEGDYNKQMVISNIKATISRFQLPRLYNYELSLISPTIQLQRIVLPNRSITQPINGTPKTIYTVLQGYLDIYAPLLSLDETFIAKTDTVVCPEWQWNMPTLFEVFNDLLSAVDCVVTMPTFDTISLLDLNKQGNPIDVNLVNNVEYNFGVEGYADRMEIEAKNVANKQRNAQMYDVVVPKSEESIATVSNALFILAKPIFEINNARIVWRRKNTVGGDVYLPAATVVTDITNHIVEQAVYDNYKVSNTTGIESGIDYKRNALYYVEGDNKIRGLGYREDTWLPMIDSFPSLINILANVEGYTYQGMQVYTTNVNDILEMGLLVQYTTIEDVKFASLKTKGTKNRSTLINNQNTTYVDISALSISQQQNVDRIGNQEMQIYGRCQNESQVPKTADYIDDYKVTARVVKFDASWLEFTAKLSKNYVIKEMFTGLNSKRRYLQFAQANDAFLSNHLQVLDFNFQNEDSEVKNQMTDYFMQIGQNLYRPNIAVVKTRSATNVPIATVGLSSSTSIIENGLIYNFKFDDNINAGYKVTKESEIFGNVLKVNNTPYVDDKGEFKILEYFLFRDINNPNFARGEYEGAPEALARARNYPSIDENYLNYDFLIYQSGSLLRHKDNREITSETLQFHFTSEPNIYVYKRFYEYNPLYYNGDNVIPVKIVLSNETEGDYTKFDTKGKSGIIVEAVIEGNSIRADFTEVDWNLISWVHAWAVIDNDNNLILANNGRRRYIYLVSSGFSITMNFKTELAVTQSISMIPLNIVDIEAYTINSDVDLNEGQNESEVAEIVQSITLQTEVNYLHTMRLIKTFSPEIIPTHQATAWVEVTLSDWFNASESGSILITPIGPNCPTITSSNAGNVTNYDVGFVMAVQGARLCNGVEPCPAQGYVSCERKFYKAVII